MALVERERWARRAQRGCIESRGFSCLSYLFEVLHNACWGFCAILLCPHPNNSNMRQSGSSLSGTPHLPRTQLVFGLPSQCIALLLFAGPSAAASAAAGVDTHRIMASSVWSATTGMKEPRAGWFVYVCTICLLEPFWRWPMMAMACTCMELQSLLTWIPEDPYPPCR